MTTKLGRFAVSASLFASLLALPCVCSAAQSDVVELPFIAGPGTSGVCDMVAEASYQGAIEAGDGLPDAVYEQVMADCDWGGYSSMTLEEQLEQDGERVTPACFFTGSCK